MQPTGVFTVAEVAYLRNVHPLARIATVGSGGTPHVMPTGSYDLDVETGTITTTGIARPAIRIRPRRIVSWGLEPGSGGRRSRDVETSP